MSAQFLILQLFLRRTLAIFGLICFSVSPALAGSIEITNYGHSSLLIKGGGKSILLNPFKAVGCASGLREPNVRADVILASSELADEGARVAKGLYFVKPGSYRVGRMQIEGFSVDHDRLGGRRFGKGTIWQWSQSGFNFAHLGGVAAPLTDHEKVLLGRPDVLILAVGGGKKVYNPEEAAQVVKDLNPKRVIPVHYLTKRSPETCELLEVTPFLDLMKGAIVRKEENTFTFSQENSDNLIINVFN